MPKYLFTSDQRISQLPERIKWVANYVNNGNNISLLKDKSDMNNATTLKFYYNIQPNTQICQEASIDPVIAIRNFVLKFQFPNTRTHESFRNSLAENTLLAPYRVVISLLFKMAEIDVNHESWLSINEILYFVFCNSEVFANPYFDYNFLISKIYHSRKNAYNLENYIDEKIEWKQYSRQCNEMFTVLKYACSSIKIRNKTLSFSFNSTDYIQDQNFIKEILNYNKFWFPSDKTNFPQAELEYISYMDTANTPYNVFELSKKNKPSFVTEITEDNIFLSALKTKPFLLLAGISGTGKSRKVQELAYMTCPRDGRLDQDKAKPGNYMLIEVKPNWHDSTELLGYYSNISGKYMLTDFIRFIYKAWLNPQVPFFVCLDEMNLAPVEQYFAEYLSVLETRKDVNGTIISAELLTKESFKDIKTDRRRPITSDEDDGVRDVTESLYSPEDALTIDYIKKNGLRLPENLFVVGTVNMDDTTHQFSRKVIDRAFTIEMNGGNLADMFDKNDTLQYQEQPLPWEVIKPDFVRAQDVLDTFEEDREAIKNKAPELLNGINQEDIFGNTPFRVNYRVMNEMILYFATLRTRNKEVSADELLNTAFMTILLQKVLPRVEGDEKALHCDDGGHSVILAKLKSFLSANFMAENSPSSTSDIYDELIKKIDEMERRLEDTYFTSFFS